MKNLRRSVRWSKTQRAFAAAISVKHPADILERWAKMREDFDNDPKKPNPYVEPRVRKCISVLLRISLAEDSVRKTLL